MLLRAAVEWCSLRVHDGWGREVESFSRNH
jgi:hypothetical protein